MPKAKSEPPATEKEILALLERKHAKQGNGGSGEYAFLTHVRNDGGFSATRTFDAVTVSLWPSRGYAIHVYEVKVSRSDWLRELKDPAKSEAGWAMGDYFSIVATAGVVDPAELPAGWGLIEAHGGRVEEGEIVGRRLRTATAATFHGVKRGVKNDVSRGLLVSMLRRAGAVPDHETPSDRIITAAIDKAVDAERERWVKSHADAREQANRLATQVRTFEQAAGVKVIPGTWQYEPNEAQILETAHKIRAALADEGHAGRVKAQLERMHGELEQAAAAIKHLIDHPERPTMGRV